MFSSCKRIAHSVRRIGDAYGLDDTSYTLHHLMVRNALYEGILVGPRRHCSTISPSDKRPFLKVRAPLSTRATAPSFQKLGDRLLSLVVADRYFRPSSLTDNPRMRTVCLRCSIAHLIGLRRQVPLVSEKSTGQMIAI